MGYSQALEEQVRSLRTVRDLVLMHKDKVDPERYEPELEIQWQLEYGDTYFWAKQLCGVMQQASADLPPSWVWSAEMLPTRAGYMWFEDAIGWLGITTFGSNLQEMPPFELKAISWSTGVIQESGRQCLNLCAYRWDATERAAVPLVALQMQQGQSILERAEDTSNMKLEGEYLLAGSCLMSTFGACMSFLQQRILIAPQQRADRPARRRLERDGYVHEPLIRVVELRRKHVHSGHVSGQESVEWSHQWVVSGHWRQQWYPSLNMNQPRWIMPYVKGPADRPLKPPRAKIFAVVR